MVGATVMVHPDAIANMSLRVLINVGTAWIPAPGLVGSWTPARPTHHHPSVALGHRLTIHMFGNADDPRTSSNPFLKARDPKCIDSSHQLGLLGMFILAKGPCYPMVMPLPDASWRRADPWRLWSPLKMLGHSLLRSMRKR